MRAIIVIMLSSKAIQCLQQAMLNKHGDSNMKSIHVTAGEESLILLAAQYTSITQK